MNRALDMAHFNRKDRFYQQAKQSGYPARSAYKLKEINDKYHIFKPHSKVVDLGCSPGGWLKVILETVTSHGKIVGVDLLELPITLPQHVTFIHGDFRDHLEEIQQILNGPADVIVSDMAPNLTGIRFKDLAQSQELADMSLDFALNTLKPGGSFLTKIFPGPDMGVYRKKIKDHFGQMAQLKVEATRKTSKEVYLFANDFQKN